MDNYKKQLEKLLFDCDYPDIEYYKEYRELFNDCDERREEVFNKINNSSFLNECYNEEKLYDRLVLNIKDQFELSRYKNVLKDKYPKELLNAYSEVANALASRSGDRKHYKKIVKFLKDVKTVDGGDEVVRDILNQWKVKYKRRKAMMEELQYV